LLRIILTHGRIAPPDRVVPVDDRGRFDGLDGNWYVDDGRRLWASIDLRF
jgi:outer membrane receptor for ferrienterochelin and colicins